MWHEARKQERKIRGMLVDYRKRAERRQDFYEKIVKLHSILPPSYFLLSLLCNQFQYIFHLESRSNTIHTNSWSKMPHTFGSCGCGCRR